MNKLQELINKLCLNGVEFYMLGELEDKGHVKLGRGNVISKDEIRSTPGDYPVYSSSSVCDGEIGRYGKYMFDDERITWSIDGGGKFFYRNNLKYSVTNVGGWIKVLDEKFINTKYLYYSLINSWTAQEYNYTKKAHPSVIKNEYSIPVPPLEVQCEIVRILDKFTSISTELLNLLSIELSSRQNQYEYYKNTLLKNYSNEANTTLKDIAEYSKDRINAVELNEDNYVGVDNLLQNKQGKRKSEHIPKEGNSTRYHINDILIGNIRPYLKKIWLATNEGGTNGDVLAIHIIKEDINPKYLYNILSSDQFFDYDNNNAKGAKMPRGNKEAIMNYEFFLPNINEQNKIVNILEAFEKISNNISLEIPVEIEARKKQYEYYRNKLLSFKEVEGDE